MKTQKRAITIKQPYAYLICAGIKDIENRTWPTKYRGRIYIHASMQDIYRYNKYKQTEILTNEQIKAAITAINPEKICLYDAFLSKNNPNRVLGALIGYVDIIDCVRDYSSIWALPDNYHWVLSNPVLFDDPILNVKGKLSFWDCSELIK